MITANDWNDALASSIAEERERLGGRPTAEEIVAYTRGELDPATTQRVRALLVYNPDLTPYLRLRERKPRFFLRLQTLAAGLLLPVLALSGWMVSNAHRIAMQPQVMLARQELRVTPTRGSGTRAATIVRADRYLLAPRLRGTPTEGTYRLQLLDLSSAEPKVVWTTQDVRPIGRSFELAIPGEFLREGDYRLDIEATDRAASPSVERFAFRVVGAP